MQGKSGPANRRRRQNWDRAGSSSEALPPLHPISLPRPGFFLQKNGRPANWVSFGTAAVSAGGQRRNACPAHLVLQVDRPETDYSARVGQLFQMPGALRHFSSPGDGSYPVLRAVVDRLVRALLAPRGQRRRHRTVQGSHTHRPRPMRRSLDRDVFSANGSAVRSPLHHDRC